MKGIAPLVILGVVAVAVSAGGGIYYSGFLQDVYVCSEKDVDVILATDTSGSMNNNCGPDMVPQAGETPCKINDAKTAVKAFVSRALGNIDNNIGIVQFSTDIETSYPLSIDNIAMLNQINSYEATGFTCLSCGINKAIELLQPSIKQDKIIVILSDAEDTEPNRCMPGVQCTPTAAFDEAKAQASLAKVKGIKIYTITFGALSGVNHMTEIATLGGGRQYYTSETDIAAIYDQVADVVLCVSCDNNGLCGAGENCENCPNYCPTPSGQVCCNGVLKTPVCTANSQCNDNLPCTTDTCVQGGTCTGTCTHTPITDNTAVSGGICCGGVLKTPTCSSDSACDTDSNLRTVGKCTNPGMCSSSCSKTTLLDNSAVSGGICCSGIVTTPRCTTSDQATKCNDFSSCTDDVCQNAGTCSAACKNTIKPDYYSNLCSISQKGWKCKP